MANCKYCDAKEVEKDIWECGRANNWRPRRCREGEFSRRILELEAEVERLREEKISGIEYAVPHKVRMDKHRLMKSLRIIRTWAVCWDVSNEPAKTAMADIVAEADNALSQTGGE